MPIVGTAGHVDHGKSLLIEKLTGVNPDRLPEEKLRGMTTDLGFTFFMDRDGRPVGVIDVPGHERFIRNMVAGAWSLDLALLVVAADDGWMAQSETHATVLRALRVPMVLPVVTKTDIVGPSRTAEVGEDVRARCAAIFGRDMAPSFVSALKMEGIRDLKDRIVQILASVPPRRREGFPYLYVDRVFSLKGTGLVVAGSLAGGPLKAGEDLRIFPGGETVRVRGLHAYNDPAPRVEPGTRTALNLPQPKTNPARGDCLAAPGAPVRRAEEFLALMEDFQEVRNHGEAEIAFASAHRLGKIHLIGGGPAARVVIDEPGAFLPGMRFLVIRHGGSDILGHGSALWFDRTDAAARRRFSALAARSGGVPSPRRVEAAMRGFSAPAGERSPGAAPGDRGAPEDGGPGSAGLRPPPGGGAGQEGGRAAPADESVVTVDGWLFDRNFLAAGERAALAAAEKPGGATPAELRSALKGFPDEALRVLLRHFTRQGKLEESGGTHVLPGKGDSLPPRAAALIEAVRRSGKNGWEPSKEGGPAPREEIRLLCRTGRMVSLGEGDIFYSAETYRDLLAALLKGKKPGDRFSIPAARDILGLSRKYMIPLLNKFEQDGWVRRSGDERVVVKAP